MRSVYPSIRAVSARTYALTKTKHRSFPRAALAAAFRSFERDDVIVAELPTKSVTASIGGTMKSNKFVPEPQLKRAK